MENENTQDNLLQPYRGTKDYFPDEMRKLNYIFNVWRKACLTFGFEEYLGPLLEYRRLYTTKSASGDEIGNQQLYWFTDSGGRELGIRPEMTPTISRMIGQKISTLAKPVRWFSIANFMRNERPQKGRLREFFQLNADIFGVKSVPIDVELVQLAIYIMKLFGASEKMFEIRINNREFFTYYISNVIGITENIQEVSRVIDNFAKYTESENIQKLKVLNLTDTQINQVLRISNLTIDSVREYVEKCTGAKDLVSLLDQLGQLGLGKYIRFEPMLVRGFDYYTGNVFEQFDLAPGNNRSMFGGGRYDKLVGIYSGIDTPANGFAPGTVTTSIFLDTWNLWPKWDNTTKVLVTVFNPNLLYKSIEIASQLRDGGVTTELYLGEKASISDQLGYASKKEISYVVICGPEESEKKQIVLKNLQTGRQETLAINSVIDMLKE